MFNPRADSVTEAESWDVTEVASGELLGMVLDVMPDAAVAVDDQGQIVAINRQAEALFGYDPGELTAKPIEVLVPERFRPQHRKHRRTYSTEPRRRPMGLGLDLAGRRKDGTEFPVDISLAPIGGPDRTLIMAALRDRTEDRAAIAAQAHLAAIINSSLDGVISMTAEGMVTSWNPGAAHLFGYRFDDMVGQHISRLFPDEGCVEFEELLAAVMSDRRVGARDTEWVTADGRRLEVGLSLSPMIEPGGRRIGISALVRDISERREAEALLRRQEEHLILATDRERIARDLHDLVIQRLFGTGMGLQGVLGLISDERAATRVAAAVDDLDTTIREIRTTIFTLETPAVAESGLRAEVLRLVGEMTEPLGFEPGVHFDGPVDSAVGDEAKGHVLAVIREGLSNIARHAKASHASVDVRVEGDVVLVIVDDGVGIGQPSHESGLANMRARAERLGGTMEIGTVPEGGSRLEWRVPLHLSSG